MRTLLLVPDFSGPVLLASFCEVNDNVDLSHLLLIERAVWAVAGVSRAAGQVPTGAFRYAGKLAPIDKQTGAPSLGFAP